MDDQDRDWILKYLEKINELRDENLKAYKETIDKALRIQATEYERRLEHLNGEQARTKEILQTYIPRELYDRDRESLDSRVKGLENWQARLLGVGVVYGLIVGILGAIIGTIVTKLFK